MPKTTLELPTDLLRRVKARAAEQGRSMKSLITEALENTLRQAEPRTTGWRTVFGRALAVGEFSNEVRGWLTRRGRFRPKCAPWEW